MTAGLGGNGLVTLGITDGGTIIEHDEKLRSCREPSAKLRTGSRAVMEPATQGKP